MIKYICHEKPELCQDMSFKELTSFINMLSYVHFAEHYP